MSTITMSITFGSQQNLRYDNQVQNVHSDLNLTTTSLNDLNQLYQSKFIKKFMSVIIEHRKNQEPCSKFKQRLMAIILQNRRLQTAQIQEQDLCQICCAEKQTHITIPCGHFRYCSSCSDKVLKSRECAYCKTEIIEMIKVNPKSVKFLKKRSQAAKQWGNTVNCDLEGESCINCQEEKKTHIAVPCGHFQYCSYCTEELQQCLVCSKDIDDFVKVFN